MEAGTISPRLFSTILGAIFILSMSPAPGLLDSPPPKHRENELQKWQDVKTRLRGILRVFRFSLENYLSVERSAPANLQSLISSPYFPFMPDDIVNPYTGEFPDLISTSGEPSTSYSPGTIVWLTGIRPETLLMTVFEDRGQRPPRSIVLEEILTPDHLYDLMKIDNSPLLPGDTWKDYAALNFVDVRLYWQCKYLYQAIKEIGFPDMRKSGRRFQKALEAWFENRAWFPGPLRKPTDGKPLSWYEPSKKKAPEPGSFSVYRVGDQKVPQCYGLMGRPISAGLEAMIQQTREQKESLEEGREKTGDQSRNKEGRGFQLP